MAADKGWMSRDAGETRSPKDEAITPREVVRILFARKLSVLLVVLLVEAGVGFGVFWFLLATYESKARLHVDLRSGATPIIRTEATYVSDLEKLGFFETVIQEIETRDIVENVVRKLNLGETRTIGRIEMIKNLYLDFRYWVGMKLGIESWQVKRDPAAASVAAVLRNLTTSRLEGSTILEMVYLAKNGEECRRTLEAVIDEYIEYRNAFIREKALGSSDFLKREIERVRAEIRAAEDVWLDVMKQDAFTLFDDSMSGRGGSAEGTEGEVVGLLTNPRTIEEMMLHLVNMQEELERLLASHKESHPMVSRLREMIRAYTEAINKSPDLQIRLHRLQRELGSKEKIYGELLTSYENTLAMESEELRRLDIIKVIQKPDLPAGHKSPKRLLAMSSGLFLGFLLGIAYAFIAEFLDDTVKRPEDIQRKLGLEYIVSVRKA